VHELLAGAKDGRLGPYGRFDVVIGLPALVVMSPAVAAIRTFLVRLLHRQSLDRRRREMFYGTTREPDSHFSKRSFGRPGGGLPASWMPNCDATSDSPDIILGRNEAIPPFDPGCEFLTIAFDGYVNVPLRHKWRVHRVGQ
jgi:hypothetical protein